MSVHDDWATAWANVADAAACVLTDENSDLSERARRDLAWVVRGSKAAAAKLAAAEQRFEAASS